MKQITHMGNPLVEIPNVGNRPECIAFTKTSNIYFKRFLQNVLCRNVLDSLV